MTAHLNYCAMEHPECRNNGKCSGHDIEESVVTDDEQLKELRKTIHILITKKLLKSRKWRNESDSGISYSYNFNDKNITQSVTRLISSIEQLVMADREQYALKQKENLEKEILESIIASLPKGGQVPEDIRHRKDYKAVYANAWSDHDKEVYALLTERLAYLSSTQQINPKEGSN